MMEFRIITGEELDESDIFRIYGLRSQITDFAIFNSDKSKKYYLNSYFKLVTNWFIQANLSNNIYTSYKDYILDAVISIDSYHKGTRPVVKYSSIKDYVKNVKPINGDIYEVECFSYPQSIVDKITSNILEEKFWKRDLEETGKIYTVNNKYENEPWNKDKNLNMKEYTEYLYDGDKYVRCGCASTSPLIFPPSKCGTIYVPEEEERWIKVEPITFVVFKDLDIAISKDIVFAGIPFNDKEYYGDFSTTILYKYLNEIFAKDIIPSETKEEEIIQNQTKVKEYSKNVNVDEEKEIYLKLKGNNEKLIEVLKLIKEKDIDINLLNEKQIVRSRSHYGYRK